MNKVTLNALPSMLTSMKPSDRLRTGFLKPVFTVLRKDLQSELRTRYAMSALLMFILSTISIVVFSLGGGTTRVDVLSGMLWVVIFFSSMSGLSRTFVTEEERGTSMTLQLLAPPGVILFGFSFPIS